MAVLKIHSHPTGYPNFSPTDDESDRELFQSVFSFVDKTEEHASAVMLPNGRIFGRWFDSVLNATPLSTVAVVGDELEFWRPEIDTATVPTPEHAVRDVQAFGRGTHALLRTLRAAVVGCSGTGSFVVEQLARLGIGHLTLIDPDVVEYKNLNRIVNAVAEDAACRAPKVAVLARAVARMGLGTTVDAIQRNIVDTHAVRAISSADVVFGCMDGVEGRNLLSRVCATYVMPYFDVGVRLHADGKGGIEEICGTVHYLQPDGSSLLDRHVYTREQLDAEALHRSDPKEYEKKLREGYIRGVPEDRPAVVSVNAFYAALCVNEFLARIHPYRWTPNREYAQHRFSLTRDTCYPEPDGQPSQRLKKYVGRGDMVPLLDMPELTEAQMS